MYVERIFISPERGAPQIECDQISVEYGRGVVGDRNFGKDIHPGQNITLVEAEEIELFLSLHDRLPDLSLTRRNLVTRGVRLNELLGKEFMICDVQFRGVELCEPCTILASCLETEAVPSAQTIRAPLNDIDVIFYDPHDEDGQRARAVETRLRIDRPGQNWEVRNQPVMHARNGDAPYRDSGNAMTHWPEIETAVGARLDKNSEICLLALFGTNSLLAGHITHNPKRSDEVFNSRVISKHWLQQWPSLRIVA